MRKKRIASRWRDLISRYCCMSGVPAGSAARPVTAPSPRKASRRACVRICSAAAAGLGAVGIGSRADLEEAALLHDVGREAGGLEVARQSCRPPPGCSPRRPGRRSRCARPVPAGRARAQVAGPAVWSPSPCRRPHGGAPLQRPLRKSSRFLSSTSSPARAIRRVPARQQASCVSLLVEQRPRGPLRCGRRAAASRDSRCGCVPSAGSRRVVARGVVQQRQAEQRVVGPGGVGVLDRDAGVVAPHVLDAAGDQPHGVQRSGDRASRSAGSR